MRPVSDAFLRTLRGSHVATARARVCAPGQTGTNPVGTEIKILGGDVVYDGNADVRATLQLEVDGTQAWPANPAALLAPYGNEIFVERGIAYGNGVTEWVSQGYYRIETIEQDDPPDGPIVISGSDRMQGVIDSKLLVPVPYAANTPIGSIVSDLITGARRAYVWDVTIEWDDATDAQLTARSSVADEDRYAYLNDIITSYGKIWFFDHRGVLVIKTPPDPGAVVWAVDAGRDGVLVSMKRNLSRIGIYNGVTAYGEATDTKPPAIAYAVDLNPDSPTYWYGSFGFQTRRYFSPFITTTAQALSAASKILQQSLGAPYAIDFSAVPNPALEPFDPVNIAYPVRSRSLSNRVETHVVTQLRVPLDVTRAIVGSTRQDVAGTIGEPS